MPADAPQVPLARDVAAAQKAARLTPRGERRQVELDLRTATGLRRSHLLHRLGILGVDWGTLEEGRSSRSTFRETWTLSWDPVMSVRLVECASYGTSLQSAATAVIVEQASAATSLARTAALVTDALLADLATAAQAAAVALGTLAATAPDIAELIDALVPLASALRYGDVRGSDSVALRTVVDEMVVRVIAGLELASRHLDDDAAAAMIERLSGLQGALGMLDHPARHGDLPAALTKLADGRGIHGLVRGRATRLLHDVAVFDADEVFQRVSRALTPGTPASEGARFVEGFLAGSGTVLVHDSGLLDIVDTWISTMSNDVFVDVVALLRRTFGAFEPAERRQLGVLVTTTTRDATTPFGADVDEVRAAAGLATVRAMLGLEPRTFPFGGAPANERPAAASVAGERNDEPPAPTTRPTPSGQGGGGSSSAAAKPTGLPPDSTVTTPASTLRSAPSTTAARSVAVAVRPMVAASVDSVVPPRRCRDGSATSAGTSRSRSYRCCNATPSSASTSRTCSSSRSCLPSSSPMSTS